MTRVIKAKEVVEDEASEHILVREGDYFTEQGYRLGKAREKVSRHDIENGKVKIEKPL